jgi:hypothetical protein
MIKIFSTGSSLHILFSLSSAHRQQCFSDSYLIISQPKHINNKNLRNLLLSTHNKLVYDYLSPDGETAPPGRKDADKNAYSASLSADNIT